MTPYPLSSARYTPLPISREAECARAQRLALPLHMVFRSMEMLPGHFSMGASMRIFAFRKIGLPLGVPKIILIRESPHYNLPWDLHGMLILPAIACISNFTSAGSRMDGLEPTK